MKDGKGKEVSYNALATHIIAEDGDNPEVGESREVFDLPVVKVRKPDCFLGVVVDACKHAAAVAKLKRNTPQNTSLELVPLIR